MNCRRVEQLLSDQMEGRLTGWEASAVALHLDGCSTCRQRQETFTTLGTELRGLTDMQPPPDMAQRAIARWGAERLQAAGDSRQTGGRNESWPPFLMSPPFAPIGAALAVAAVAAVLALSAAQREPQSGEKSGPNITISPSRPTNVDRPRLHVNDSVTNRLPPAGPKVPTPGQRAPWSSPQLLPPQLKITHDHLMPGVPRRPGISGPQALGSAPALVLPGTGRPSDDLNYLNGSPEELPRWVLLKQDEWEELEDKVRRYVQVKDDFITIPFPRIAAGNPETAVVQAVEAYKREAAVVDPRLAREVTCAFKAMALSDVFDRLRSDTGIQLVAGNSVADEKVTLFCEDQPLRDVMRQLSGPFGYAWLRSGKPGEYRYELAQDLRSQLLQEELRNRNRNEALLALEREMDRYRRYLDLTPDEALRRARTVAPSDKPLLENLAGSGWGPIHQYFRLSPRDMEALRTGQSLTFSEELKAGTQLPVRMGQPSGPPLSTEVARGVLQSLRNRRVVMREGRFWNAAVNDPNSVPLTAVPEARALITLKINHGELGQFTLTGNSGYVIFNEPSGKMTLSMESHGPYAVGLSPAANRLDNKLANAKLASDPSLRSRITVRPQASCGADVSPRPSPSRRASAREPAGGGEISPVEGKVTSADVLEALHRATGIPIVADFYTRLYKPEVVSVSDRPIFTALCDLADTMRLHWKKEAGSRGPGAWLRFRSASYYDDRLKEVPNRLLSRWSASRQRHGLPTVDDLLEIAGLTDAQLDAADMAEGARECWSLREWDLARGRFQRPHLRFLAQLTPAQRQEAMSDSGLPFTRMSLAQQQRFIALPTEMGGQLPRSLEALGGAVLRLSYTRPGGFQVQAAPPPGGQEREPAELALVCEPTRAAALQAAQRLNPQVGPAEIIPTELAVTVMYRLGGAESGSSRVLVRATPRGVMGW